MRYRINRLGSGFEFIDLTNEKAEIIHDGGIITYRPDNPIAAMIGGQSIITISESTTAVQLITALENEI